VRIVVGLVWLWAFLALGDLAVAALQLPLPGSVVGMVLLWIALESGAIRLAWLERGAGTLLRTLGLLFVPAGVGFVQFLGAGGTWAVAALVIGVGALVTLAVSGHVVQRSVGRG
jgi:holin-like protein